jgi:hypothetical protein
MSEKEYPFFDMVPLGLEKNRDYRIDVREWALNDPEKHEALMQMCAEDVLFFFSVFCFLFEPRNVKDAEGNTQGRISAFVPWVHQIPVIKAIDENLGKKDIGIEKSRGEGASWIMVLIFLHRWLFHPMSALGLVSRNEKAVDNPDDPDSLLWKVSWELGKLPEWMVPASGEFTRKIENHSFVNHLNNSTLVGYAATGDVASGGRKLCFGMDELAKFQRGPDQEAMSSTEPVTESRLIVSTPKGEDGAYYDAMHQPSSMVKLILDWKDNPARNKGLYTYTEGKMIPLDPIGSPLPPGYQEEAKDLIDRLSAKGYKLEGSVRAPWYDERCDRLLPHQTAQEYDRSYGGSVFKLFGKDFSEAAKKTVMQPFNRVNFGYHSESLVPLADRSNNGPLKIWFDLGPSNGPPPNLDCVIGCDIGAGLGGSHTSNSVACVYSKRLGYQVAEFASPSTEPMDFADLVIALCKWFGDAYLGWEINGAPGSAFTKRIIDQGYPNIYHRDVEWKRFKKKSKEIGWHTNAKNKSSLLQTFKMAVMAGDFAIRSEMLMKECGQYEMKDGKVVHKGSIITEDDSSKGEAHGDRTIAASICWHVSQDRESQALENLEDWKTNPPRGTMAERQAEYEAAIARKSDDWEDPLASFNASDDWVGV